MENSRPLTRVTYELEIITAKGEVGEEFSVSYDSEMYDGDRDSTDSIFVNMRMAELREKHGYDAVLLEWTVEREEKVLGV